MTGPTREAELPVFVDIDSSPFEWRQALPVVESYVVKPHTIIGLVLVAVHLESDANLRTALRFRGVGAVDVMLRAIQSDRNELHLASRGSVELFRQMMPGIGGRGGASDPGVDPTAA